MWDVYVERGALLLRYGGLVGARMRYIRVRTSAQGSSVLLSVKVKLSPVTGRGGL
jgi:hypothetical protein